ncbi:MAG: hypothetical protein KAX87_01770 [Nitrospira sp.]|nr:hypothetical protein [Nitrospira sp.]
MWAPAMTGMLGVWLAAAPDVMGYGGHARLSNQLVGVWMAAFGAIAMSECLRVVQWANLALGVWLVAAPFLLEYPDERACGSLAVGIATILLALVRAPLREHFGGGWTSLWRSAER